MVKYQNVEFEDVGPFVGEAELKKFESEIGTSLVSDYREFLRKVNGGIPEPSGLHFNGRGTFVSEFFPLDISRERVFELVHEYRNPEDKNLHRKGFIAFALDVGGSRFYLSIKSGEVILLDPYIKRGPISIAHSFSEFVELLEE